MKKDQILYIDEDFASIRYYLKELADEQYDVEHIRSTDAALEAINKNDKQYNLIILDSAMPPGKEYENQQTESGTATGGFLFADIQKKQLGIPIIILTNFDSLEWIQKAEILPKVRVLKKLDTLPRELVSCVKSMIKANQ